MIPANRADGRRLAVLAAAGPQRYRLWVRETKMRLRFDDFEFDTDRRELRRGVDRLALSRKPYTLLSILLEERHRVVPFEELMERAWPGVHVSQATLASTLRDLRRALGDEGYDPHLIGTVRGQGLRFLGTVQEVSAPPETDRLVTTRERLVDRLSAGLDAARAGRGRIALIAGHAGMGKTRVTSELAERARAGGFSVQIGRCADSVLDPPYGVWVQILTGLAEARPQAEVDAALEGGAGLLARIVPAIADRVPAALAEGAIEIGDLDARYRLFDRVATFVRRLASATPILFVVEDLDRAALSSLEVLEFVASWCSEAPLFVVGTYRPTAVGGHSALARTIAELDRVARCEQHRLEGLSREEVREFVERSAGLAPSAQFCAAIHERSGGNPFFLRELVRHELASAGAAAFRNGAAPHPELPPSLREAIQGRVLALSLQTQGALARAALLGSDFGADVVARVSELSDRAARLSLEEAQRAGIVEPGASGRWRFSHALVREAIAEQVSPTLRMQLHGRIGEVLRAEVDRDSAGVVEVAHHLSRAAERVALQAADAVVRAAHHAERSFAFADAAGFYETALELRSRAPQDQPAQRCELLLGLSQARLWARDVQGAWDAARRAAELARRIGDPVKLARAGVLLGAHFHIGFEEPLALLEEALPDVPADMPALRAAVLSTITAQLHYARQPKRRIMLAEQALEAARSAGSPEMIALALMAMRNALCAPEALARRLQVGSERVEWADRIPHSAQRCLARGERAVDRYTAGEIEAAERDADDIDRIAKEIQARSMQSFPLRWCSLRRNGEGRFPEAAAAARGAFELMQLADDPNAVPDLAMQLGMVYYESGRWVELDALLAASAGWLEPYRALVPSLRACLANFDLLRGRRDAALCAYNELVSDDFAALDGDPEPLVTTSWLAGMMLRLEDSKRAEQLYERLGSYGDQFVIFNFALAARGSFAHPLGILARTAGRLEDAARHLAHAIEANRQIGAPLFEARARLDLAALLASRRDERAIELERAACAALAALGVAAPAQVPAV